MNTDYFSTNGFQVVLKTPAASSRFHCQVIDQLPCPNPVLITVAPGAVGQSEVMAARASQAILLALRSYAVRFTNTLPPCGPIDRGLDCFAHDQPACRKVLVLVGDGAQIQDPTGSLGYWCSKLNAGDRQYVLLPVCPEQSKSAMASALQSWLPGINVFGWTAGPEDVVPSVCASAGIVPEDYRVFISYRREDGQVHADKLFDALTQRGFDVFLDRVRIAPGANILDRIKRDLADKSFLLVLETPLLNRSSWVAQEIAFAAAHRIGILAIHFPSGTTVPSIGNYRRINVNASHITAKDELSDSAADSICRLIVSAHNRWIIRRRNFMQQAMRNALLYRSVFNHRVTSAGTVEVYSGTAGTNQRYVLGVSPRVLELQHFCQLERGTSVPPPVELAVIGPSAQRFGSEHTAMEWLAEKCDVSLYDETELADIASRIASGGGL